MGILSGAIETVKNIIGGKPAEQGANMASPNVPLKFDELSPYQAFRNKEEVINYAKTEFERRQKERRPKELQWVLNQNFLNGNQFCDINVFMQEVQQIEKLYEWQEREVFNQIAPIYETRLAKLKKNRPIPFTIPATQESSDINTAKTTTSILKGIDKDQNITDKRALGTAWAEICGCVFYKRTWNPKGGRLVGSLEGKPVYEGCEQIDLVSPFEIFPDSNFANGVEGCRSIIHARAYHKDEIEERWPTDAEGNPVQITGRKLDVFTLSQTNVGIGGLGYMATVYNFVSTEVEDHEIVIEFDILPCKKFPHGLIIITAEDKLLYFGPHTYNVGEDMKPGFNLTMQVCIETPGYFWPVTVLERLIPIQRSYNAVKNRKHEALNRIAIGVLDVEDDGNLDIEDLEQEGLFPGKVLTHQRGSKPAQFLDSHGNTSEFAEEEKRLEEQFAMISGVSPFSSQSLPPSGVVSGDAMEQLKESDDSRIGLTADNINSAAIKGWKIDIRLNRQFAKGPRLLRYVGENNDVELIDWQASDLTSDDIIIDNIDELSQTPAQKRMLATQFLQYGLYDETKVPPKTRSKFLETFSLGNPEEIDDIEDKHIAKAKRENKGILAGKMPVFKDYDMHDLHKQEHDRLRLDVSYEEFEQANPQLAAAFDAHCAMHQQAIEQAQAALLQQMNPQQEQKPSQSIPYKDLPPSGKIQQAAQAGINLTPEDVGQQLQIEALSKQKSNQPKEKAS